MTRKKLLEPARQASGTVLPPALTIAALTAAICWLVGWRTLDEIAVALIVAGALVFGVGAFGMLGGRALDGNYRYMAASSVSSEDYESRKLRRMLDNNESFAFLLLSSIVAALLFGLALTIFALA